MSLLYAIEGWVLAVLGWGWLTLRDLIPERPLAEELSVYSTLAVSTITLGLCAALRDRSEVMRAYLGFTLVVWTYLTYALLDCIPIYDTGSRYVPDVGNSTVLCCPNVDVAGMNRAFYFGNLTLFLVPGAVTLAFQTLQVFIAGAAYVSIKESVWPGNAWGYSIAAVLSTVYFARFSGLVEPPCPGGDFNTLFGLGIGYGGVFGFFAFALMLLILLDGMDLPTGLASASRAFGLAIVSLFCVSVGYASDGRGMLTLPMILLLVKAWVPVLWSVGEPWWTRRDPGADAQPPDDAGRHRTSRRSVRWVVPINTNLAQQGEGGPLPAPLVMMDPPSDSSSSRDRKKRA